MRDYFLLFSSHFNRDNGLDQGRLSLNSLSEGTKVIWVASSSHINGQETEGFHKQYGYIPPQYRVPGLKNWEVETKPISLIGTKGVEGNFYKILPFEVVTDRNGKRGDFGIHRDAGALGSLGCIVMTGDRFKEFESRMTGLRDRGISKLPLFIQYS